MEKSMLDEVYQLPGMEHVMESMARGFKIIVAILIPVVSIAVVVASVIVMIFEVFFSLALFVAYKNGFAVPVPVEPLGVLAGLEMPAKPEISQGTEQLAAPDSKEQQEGQEVDQ
jgi:hypothetical protein